VEVFELEFGEPFPPLLLGEASDFANALSHMDKVEPIAGELPMLAAKLIAQFPPTCVVIGLKRTSD